MARNLTKKQELFVAAYLLTLNATKAAESAGYSKRTADKQGSQLLAIPRIAKEIAEKTQKRCEKLDISAEKVLGELKKCAESNMFDFYHIDEHGRPHIDLTNVTREQAAAIQEVNTETFMVGRGENKREVTVVRVKLWDKPKANELLGKHLKLFTEKLEVSGSVSIADRIAKGRQRVAERS